MNRVVDRATRVQLQEDRMVLQLFPQDFVVDDHPGHRDPRKMLASRLEINVHLVTTSVQEHNSLVGAVNQAHLAVEETVFEALAACYAAVLPEDRRAGNCVDRYRRAIHRTGGLLWRRHALWLPPCASAATISRAIWRRDCASASKMPSW